MQSWLLSLGVRPELLHEKVLLYILG
jgi:hypothetical protein